MSKPTGCRVDATGLRSILVGGESSIVLSTTTIIIALLVLMLIIVGAMDVAGVTPLSYRGANA